MHPVMLTISWLLIWGTGTSAQVAVIANKSVPVDTLKKFELLNFYTGDVKKWQDDKPVIVLDLRPKVEVKVAFYNFLGKSPSRMKSVWLKKMLSGEGDPPEALDSEKDVLKKVATTAGAIGFVNKATVSQEVKILMEINVKK